MTTTYAWSSASGFWANYQQGEDPNATVRSIASPGFDGGPSAVPGITSTSFVEPTMIAGQVVRWTRATAPQESAAGTPFGDPANLYWSWAKYNASGADGTVRLENTTTGATVDVACPVAGGRFTGANGGPLGYRVAVCSGSLVVHPGDVVRVLAQAGAGGALWVYSAGMMPFHFADDGAPWPPAAGYP